MTRSAGRPRRTWSRASCASLPGVTATRPRRPVDVRAAGVTVATSGPSHPAALPPSRPRRTAGDGARGRSARREGPAPGGRGTMAEPILIWGAGAIGGTAGAYLVRAGHAVHFVDVVADHVAAIRDP